MKPRIALLVTELAMGGAAKVVRDLAAEFSKFAEVREVVFNRVDGVDFGGGEITSLDVGGGGGPINRLANFLRRVRRYRRFKDEWKPDVSFAHLEGAHYVDVLSKGAEKVVLVIHGSVLNSRDIVGLKGFVRRRILIPSALRRADAIVAVSRDIAAEMASVGFPDVRVINNFFDVDRIERMTREPIDAGHAAMFDGPPVIITAGRLAAQKNQLPLLEAFAKLMERREARLLILGDGSLRPDMLDHAEALGLRTSSPWTRIDPQAGLHFLGVQPNPFQFIARSELFALPSTWEGFPLALCEALACSTAVISADCPTGPREILAPDTPVPKPPITAPEVAEFGMLMPIPAVRSPSVHHWAETLDLLLDDSDLRARLAAAGRRRVEDFTAAAIVPQWRQLVDELLESPSNKRS